MLYEEDYKRERDEKQLFERRWIAVKDENRTLQAVIDAVVSPLNSINSFYLFANTCLEYAR